MRYRNLVVVEQAGHYRCAHTLALGLGLGRVVDDLVGAMNRVAQDDTGPRQSGLRVADTQVLAHECVADQIDNGLHGDAARDLAGVIAAHAVGEHEQANIGFTADHVLVVFADLAGIRERDAGDFPLQAHGVFFAVRVMQLNPFMATRWPFARYSPPKLQPSGRLSHTGLRDSWPVPDRSRSRRKRAGPGRTTATADAEV